MAEGFRLRKWYFDVVSAEGHATIGYVAEVGWGAMSWQYASVLDGPSSRATLLGARHWCHHACGPSSWRGYVFSGRSALGALGRARGRDGARR